MSRTTLSASGMLSAVKEIFDKIPDSCVARSNITLTDCLMSGLAIFSLKFPSLLQFEHAKEEIRIKQNLKNLYQINQAPSDTYLRERLDLIDPLMLRQPFKKMFSLLQRGNVLEQFSYIDGHYLLSLDGTGYFHSNTVHCESCCMKQYSNGTVGYYHSMLCAALVNPNYKEVIPFAPEPIIQQDGNTKNDCEQNASKRMLEHIRREHPHLKLIIIEDALSASGPHIQLLKKHRMSFIIGCKKNHDYLFKYRQDLVTKHEILSEEGTRHIFQFANQIPLNSSHPDIKINVLDYYEIDKKNKKKHFTWVTDLELTKNSVYKVMKGGRARWKIENETFNTLKNQGYHFEHNFGHGRKYLTTVFVYLMMLAFMIDQIQQLCCKLFKLALNFSKTKARLWEKIRGYFTLYLINSWEELFDAIANQKGASISDTT